MTKIKCVISAVLVFCCASVVYAQDANQDVLHKLLQIKQPQPTFNINLWINQKSYQPGDAIEFSFQTNKDCYLNLVDVATDQTIRVIFPNKYSPNNFVKAGKTYNIPGDYNFSMKVTEPTGVETIKAIATIEVMEIFDLNFTQKNDVFFAGKLSDTVVKDGLNSLGDRLKKHAWAETELKFEVKSKTSTRGLKETKDWPAPKPVPGTGTQHHNPEK